MKKIGDRDTDVRLDPEIAASVGLSGGRTSRLTATVNTVLRRWTAGRRFLLALLVAGQLIAIVGTRWTDRLWPVALPWLLSLVAGVVFALPNARVSWRQRLVAVQVDLVVAVGLTVFAALLRLPNLERMPLGIDGDEGEFGVLALSVVHGHGPSPFGVAFLGDPALFVHLLAFFVTLLGPSMAAIRLLSALAGTATIPVVYGLVRDLFGRRPAVLAALLLATSAVHIHFSRLALNVVEVPLFTGLSLWFLARGLRQRQDHWLLLSGIVGGVGLYFHFGSRMIPVILLLVLLAQAAVQRTPWRCRVRQAMLPGVGGLLALSPMIAHLSSRPQDFTSHMADRGIWTNWKQLAEQYGTVPSDRLAILWDQLRRSIEAFITKPDPFYGASFYTFMNAPLLNHVVAPVALLSLVLLWFRLRDLRAQLLLFWFAVPVIFASALTDVAGQSHRLLNPMVPAIVAAAWLIDRVIHLAAARLPARAAPLAAVVLLAAPLLAGAHEAQHYFVPAVTSRFRAAHTAQARCLQALPAGTVVLVASDLSNLANYGPTRFLAPDLERRNLKDPAEDLAFDTGGRPLVIVVHESNHDMLQEIRAVYPQAREGEIERPAGERVLTVLGIPPAGQTDTSWLDRCISNANVTR